MAGDNGGAPFVLNLPCSNPLVWYSINDWEILLGRLGRENPIDSMYKLAKLNNRSLNWKYTGWLGAFTLLLAFLFIVLSQVGLFAYFYKYFIYLFLTQP